jgi:hypothetical protein
MRATVLLAFKIKAWRGAEDVQPGTSVAPDFDLGFDRLERIEGLVEQIAYDGGLRLVAGGADIADRQVVVDAHVALDEARDLPIVRRPVVALEDEDVTAAGGATVALAPSLAIGMGERAANGVAQRLCVARLRGAHSVREPSFFHVASCRTA